MSELVRGKIDEIQASNRAMQRPPKASGATDLESR